MSSNDYRKSLGPCQGWGICRPVACSHRGARTPRIAAARNIPLSKKNCRAIGLPAGGRASSTGIAMSDQRAVLEVRDLKKHFPIRKGFFQRAGGTVFAVDGVSFTIQPGETLGLVGASGCGKTTVGRTLTPLIAPNA